MQVVRRALDVFACTRGASGAYTLNVDPSIECWDGASVQATLIPYAALSIVGYGLGVPALFAATLYRQRESIVRDQKLWMIGRGDRPETNPDFQVRQRFSKLYQVRPTRS